MGDVATLAKARMELEELYLGIPDESVNLTFQDLAEVTQNVKASEKKKSTKMEPISEVKTPRKGSPLIKIPSLDFNTGFQHVMKSTHDTGDHLYRGGHDHHHHSHATRGHRYVNSEESLRSHASPDDHRSAGFRHAVEGRSIAYDDVSGMNSMASMHQERGGRRRPGIPHSNICTVCSTYIYIFRHRCLVCGRAYCRQCVNIGMGEMTEGRKCIECLGRRFSQRYIERAGKMGCWWRYPSMVKVAEVKWAERGPRRSGERAYEGHGRSGMMSSRSRSPMTPRAHAATTSTPPSFVMNSPYSPYGTPTHHHLPF